jgi:hypothetical protein
MKFRASSSRSSLLLLTGLLCCCALASGCGRSKLQAPVLDNGPVYKNRREGFRFLVPEAWIQLARGEAPPGPLADEHLLVEYQIESDKPAGLRVTCVDFPDRTRDLADYVRKQAPKEQAWHYTQGAVEETVNGVKADHVVLKSRMGGKEEWVRDVMLIRRGERVYLFNGLYAAADRKAAQEIRRTLDSVIWDR